MNEPHERLMPGWWWYSLPVDDRRTISGSVYHLRNFDLPRLSAMRTGAGSFGNEILTVGEISQTPKVKL